MVFNGPPTIFNKIAGVTVLLAMFAILFAVLFAARAGIKLLLS